MPIIRVHHRNQEAEEGGGLGLAHSLPQPYNEPAYPHRPHLRQLQVAYSVGATKFQATEGGYLWREWVEELNRKSAELGGGPVGIVSFGPQVEHTHMAADLCFDPSEV